MKKMKSSDLKLLSTYIAPYQVKKINVLSETEKTSRILNQFQDSGQLSLLVGALKTFFGSKGKVYFCALMNGYNRMEEKESHKLFSSAAPIQRSLIPDDLHDELRLLISVGIAREIGFFYDEKHKRYSFNANAFAKHFITRCNVKSTKDGRLFFYHSKGVYEELSEVEVGKIIRVIMHEGLHDSWTSSRETEVVKALLREAETVDAMNSMKNYINLENGMLDLTQFKLVHHSPKYLSTVQLPMEYNPNLKAPTFSRFIREITLADEELANVLQEVLGYLLSNETKAEKAFYFYGGGANGKSVLASIITELVGKDNVSSIPLIDFGQRFGLEGIINKTVNIAAENELGGKALKTENFKAIVSGDVINIEIKYRSPISYKPHCKLVFLVNSLPDSMDVTNGYFRKLMIIPFKRTFKPEERDVELIHKLVVELPGILNWALVGLQRLQKNNYQFSECKAINQAHETYYLEQNPVKDFFGEHIRVNPNQRTKRAQFHEMYVQWLDLQGIDDKGTRSKQAFWRYFKIVLENSDISIVQKKIKGIVYFEGIEIVGLEASFSNYINFTK